MQKSMSNNPLGKIIHVGKYHIPRKDARYLFLRQRGPCDYVWYEEEAGKEIDTEMKGNSIEEAMRLAQKKWKKNAFRTIICGFRYTLPERDEHGTNALFYQMAASYKSPNGVYFDEELGHNCFVQSASTEALNILQRLKESNRL
jgi:hypothetical protein